jgi:hypothetical protein
MKTQYFYGRDVCCFTNKQLDGMIDCLPELRYKKILGANRFPKQIFLIEDTPESKIVFKFDSIGTDLETGLTHFHYKSSELTSEELAPYLEKLPSGLNYALKREIIGRRADLLGGFDSSVQKPLSWVDAEIMRLRSRRAENIAAISH